MYIYYIYMWFYYCRSMRELNKTPIYQRHMTKFSPITCPHLADTPLLLLPEHPPTNELNKNDFHQNSKKNRIVTTVAIKQFNQMS